MKRKKGKYRFYIWDYLWWLGERTVAPRVNGATMLMMYVLFFVILPLKGLGLWLYGDGLWYYGFLLAIIILLLLGYLVIDKIYSGKRRKAVMKHYADRSFSQTKGLFIFSLPMILLLTGTAIYIAFWM